MSKKEMQKMKRLKFGTDLNRLASFDDARILLDENVNMVCSTHSSLKIELKSYLYLGGLYDQKEEGWQSGQIKERQKRKGQKENTLYLKIE